MGGKVVKTRLCLMVVAGRKFESDSIHKCQGVADPASFASDESTVRKRYTAHCCAHRGASASISIVIVCCGLVLLRFGKWQQVSGMV